MTREQQKNLAKALREAAETQGVLQKELAVAAGTSSGNLSYAMACKSRMSEEKWRLACEFVGVDFDSVIGAGMLPSEGMEAQREEDMETMHERPKKLRIKRLEGEFFEYCMHGELVELVSGDLVVRILPSKVTELCEEIAQACEMLTKA